MNSYISSKKIFLFHEEWFRNDFCSTENDFGTGFVLQNKISSIEYFLKGTGRCSNLDHKIRVFVDIIDLFLFYGNPYNFVLRKFFVPQEDFSLKKHNANLNLSRISIHTIQKNIF